jgi:hypothetical protein
MITAIINEQNCVRKQVLYRTLTIFFMLIMTAFFVGCNGSASAIAGKWIPESGGSAPRGLPDNMELFKDGKGIVEGVGINWKLENGRLYIIHPLIASSWSYKISGSTLTLTNDDNNRSEIYKKQK